MTTYGGAAADPKTEQDIVISPKVLKRPVAIVRQIRNVDDAKAFERAILLDRTELAFEDDHVRTEPYLDIAITKWMDAPVGRRPRCFDERPHAAYFKIS